MATTHCPSCDRPYPDMDGTATCPRGCAPAGDQDDWLDYMGLANG